MTSFEVERHYKAVSNPVRQDVDAAAEDVFSPNPERKGIIIQNVGTTVLKFSFGDFTPTQLIYSFSLKAGSALDDALGGLYLEMQWTMRMQVISSAAGGVLVKTEFF